MKILSAQQMAKLDALTIQNDNILSIDLMERAAMKFVDAIIDLISKRDIIYTLSGMGNNGGDGLAIARLLAQRGFKVKAFYVACNSESSADFNENKRRLESFVPLEKLSQGNYRFELPENAIVIDALFGTGLSKPITNWVADVVHYINDSQCTVISVDMPSGLYSDKAVTTTDVIIEADHTITFHLPKLAYFIPENEVYVGNWQVVDIALSTQAIAFSETPYYLSESKTIEKNRRKRNRFDHKGTFGHSLLIGGSKGMIGAMILASKACMRAGAGLCTVLLPECGYTIMQSSNPEVMCLSEGETHIDKMEFTKKFDAIGIGPGLSLAPETQAAFSALLKQLRQPIVLDADAINSIAANPELLEQIPPQSIITPHPLEFDRLAGASSSGYERLEKARNFARKHKITVVLKGAFTAVINHQAEVYFNCTGNPGMATAGSGDVLTGVITSLLGQDYPPFEAARLGVYLHGKAGDLVTKGMRQHALIASDIVEQLRFV